MNGSKTTIEAMSARGAYLSPTDKARLWPMPVMVHQLNVHRATVYTLMKDHGLPQPVRLSARRVAWVASEVEAWIASRARGGSAQIAA